MKISLVLISALLSFASMANIIGISTHPVVEKKHAFNTAFNTYLSDGNGTGLTARYNYRMDDLLSFDAGMGITEGSRENRVFVGADFKMLPDYGSQPRTSLKAILETADEFGERHNKIGIAPTISKGFNFWGKEGYPFIALPVLIDLNNNESSFKTSSSIATGITTYYNTMTNLIFNVEANIGLANSYNSIVAGMTLMIE